MLIGINLYLRPMEERDVTYKVKWLNDAEVRRTLNFDYPISEISTRQWLVRVATDTTRRDFVACLREDDSPIGYAGLMFIDRKASKAELYVGIGEKQHWGKGYGKEITGIQLAYGFIELGLNKLYTHTWSKNEIMIAINKKFGFEIEGTLRQDVFSHGEFRDRVLMGLLRADYMASRSIT